MTRLFFCMLTATLPLIVHATTRAQVEPGGPPSEAQLAQWVDQLDADEFLVREMASEQLVRAGVAAIEPVEAGLDGRSLEARTRGIHILRQLAISSDLDVEEAARQALERIAAAPGNTAARLAAGTLAQLDGLREQRALEELVRLGAKTQVSHRQLGINVVPFVDGIEIDEKWTGQDQDLRRLRFLREVRAVRLVGPQVSNEWLRHVSTMKNLNSLELKHARVDQQGLAQLSGMQNLISLEIKYSPVGDAAVDHLAELGQLTSVKLYGTQISPEAADRLRRALAGAKVDHRAGGFLGVGCQNHLVGCAIALIHPGSAASQVGLATGDVIFRYQGERVTDFDGLTAQISKNRVAEEVTFAVLRGAHAMTGTTDHREGDPLGIQGKVHELGCQVAELAPDSAAARAGLRQGDIIARYNEAPVTDPESLEKLFAQNAPGRRTTFEFVRGGQISRKTVKLGEWD